MGILIFIGHSLHAISQLQKTMDYIAQSTLWWFIASQENYGLLFDSELYFHAKIKECFLAVLLYGNVAVMNDYIHSAKL